MKKLLIATLLFAMLAATPVFAADSNGTKATYKVTLSITYNAVSAEEAARITRESLLKHDKACKNSVKIDKNALFTNSVSYITATIQ